MGVSINGGTPKMDALYSKRNPIKIGDLGVPPL